MVIKLLAKSVGEYKKEALFAWGLMVLEVIMEVLIPFFTASLIDFGIDSGNMDYIVRMGTMLIVFALMSLLFGAGSGFFSASAAAGFAANLRRDVFAAIQRFSFSNIDRFSSASLVTRLKTFISEAYEKRKFKGISAEVYEAFLGGQHRVAFNMPLIQLCTYVSIILVSWIGARQIVSHTMTTGDLMSMFAYVMQILMNLMMLSVVFVQIIIARSSAQRIVAVLKEEPHIQNPARPIREVRDGSISFESVDFSYVGDKSKLCLKGAHFTIGAGETIGIIGGTGSSKTSLVQLIPRLYDVTQGAVRVGGVDVRDYDIEVLRNEVAMVLQSNVLFSGTIGENLRWGNPNATDAQVAHAAALAQADGFIASFPRGYDTHIEEGGMNVSGGQRQRLCIARTLLKSPKILILDDSTSAVDTKTDASIRRAFREDIPGTTKLIIAQRISSVRDADRIIVLDGGTINAMGTHDELLEHNAIYQDVYETQTQGGGDFDE